MIPVSYFVKAQPVQFGIKGGLNVASVHDNATPNLKSRVSAHAGGLAHIHLSKEFALQPELLFSGQGFIVDAATDQYYKLNYLNLPVLLQFMTQSGFRIETGPQLGVLLSAKYKIASTEDDIKDVFKPVDFAWAFGLGYLTKSGFGVDARYNLGISKIYENSNDVTNRVFQLGVFYQFKNAK
jgi:hypothetical protein